MRTVDCETYFVHKLYPLAYTSVILWSWSFARQGWKKCEKIGRTGEQLADDKTVNLSGRTLFWTKYVFLRFCQNRLQFLFFSEGKRLLSCFIQCLLQVTNNSTCGQLTRVAGSTIPLIYAWLLEKGIARKEWHNNRPNAEFSNHMTLPPMRRICSNAQEANSEGGNSPLMFLKLPRLERRPVVKNKTPSSLQENEQKNESYKSYVAIDKNFPP